MKYEVLFKIRNNDKLYEYLKYNSYWYKILNRDANAIRDLEQEMKKTYKITTSDKLEDLNSKITMIRTFLDVLR